MPSVSSTISYDNPTQPRLRVELKEDGRLLGAALGFYICPKRQIEREKTMKLYGPFTPKWPMIGLMIHIYEEHNRNKGYGTRLLQMFIKSAREMGAKAIFATADLHTFKNDFNLVEWYKHNGFRVIGEFCSTNGVGSAANGDPYIYMEL